jgi:hypothetical protein
MYASQTWSRGSASKTRWLSRSESNTETIVGEKVADVLKHGKMANKRYEKDGLRLLHGVRRPFMIGQMLSDKRDPTI